MSYEVCKDEMGQTLVEPLELPFFSGSNSDLGWQATVAVTSFLRHSAVCDWMDSNLDITEPDVYETFGQEKAQAASQLTTALMSLVGMAENLGIDIMQEIWDAPWEA